VSVDSIPWGPAVSWPLQGRSVASLGSSCAFH